MSVRELKTELQETTEQLERQALELSIDEKRIQLNQVNMLKKAAAKELRQRKKRQAAR